MAMLLTMLGVAGLLAEASPVPHPIGSMCIDLIFGLALWTQVVLRFYRRVNQSPAMQPSEVKAFSRRLSRMVYLLLYVLVFARQAILMLSPVGRGGAIGGFHRALRGPSPTIPPFLVYGLAALVLINGLTAWWNHNAPKVPRDAV
jgi:cytochrome b561